MAHVAIFTKYLGPGNTRGSRIKATWGADSVTIPYPSQLSGMECHLLAAETLRRKLAGKSGRPQERIYTLPLEGAGMGDDSGYVFVLNPAARHLARVLVSRCEKGQSGNPYGYRSIREARAFFSPSGDWQSDSYKSFTGYAVNADGISTLPEND